ncbi:CsoS2 family carboxysome shell protein [Litoricolaceae bacterium]|nr:CsoS2 family carboxysome shell protein [Litorivicinaceae bacterium]
MTTTKTGRDIALERRAALSTHGKASGGQGQPLVASSETDATTQFDGPMKTLSARERRQRMSQTGQAHLPVVERTRAMVVQHSSQRTSQDAHVVKPSIQASDHSVQTPKSDAQRRREQLSKYGKAGLSASQSPAMESRTRAQSLRGMRSQVGQGVSQESITSSLDTAPIETDDSDRVSGTPLAQNPDTIGVDRGLSRGITGTEYFSGEIFQELCPRSENRSRPVNHESRITGRVATSQLLRPETQYANDVTADGLTITGGETVHGRITGTDADRSPRMSGSQYRNVQLGSNARSRGRDLLMDSGRLTGHFLDGHRTLTGATQDRGSDVTGDNYADNRRTSRAQRPAPSRIDGARRIHSGTRISGIRDESDRTTGTPDAVRGEMSGTPYIGSDARPREMSAHAVTGTQPAIGSGITGDSRGADGPISGTPYLGEDHLATSFGYEPVTRPDRQFSVMTQRHASKPYTRVTSGITGSFGKGDGKITGVNDASFAIQSTGTDQDSPTKLVTGEGAAAGQKITGDDWDRNPNITGTEGRSSKSRNTTRRGAESTKTASVSRPDQRSREIPVSKVTGSSGNTSDGALITYSGGARG